MRKSSTNGRAATLPTTMSYLNWAVHGGSFVKADIDVGVKALKWDDVS